MTRLLVVDDEPMNLVIIGEALEDLGLEIEEADDGESAWQLMQSRDYDLIVLDRMMPKLDGIGLLHRMKADPRWKNIPVIMQTAAANQVAVREGLEAGAHYYLTKPYDPDALRILVQTVVDDLQELARIREASTSLQSMIGLLAEGEFEFRTLSDAHHLASGLALLCNDTASASMGLIELLVNAVEHGNLGISYDEKTVLRKNSQWESEIERRLALPEYAGRRARVKVRREADTIEFTVTDQGGGFDWQPYLEFDPARAFDLNGRGIAMAGKFAFDFLAYEGVGNVVRVKTRGRSTAG